MLSLKEIRTARGLTIKQVGEIVGKSSSSVFGYEAGKVKVPDKVYEALSQHFGITVEELRNDSEPDDRQETAPVGEVTPDSDVTVEESAPVEADPVVGDESDQDVPVEAEGSKAEESATPDEASAEDLAKKAKKAKKKPGRPKKEKKPDKAEPKLETPRIDDVLKDLPAPAAKSEEPVMKFFVQSMMGGSISMEEIAAKVKTAAPFADTVYVKPEENKAYWTGNGKLGAVELWD